MYTKSMKEREIGTETEYIPYFAIYWSQIDIRLSLKSCGERPAAYCTTYNFILATTAPGFYHELVHELSELWVGMPVPSSLPPSNHEAATATHVLFFDGGSRGNPGPGGSSACVVRHDDLTGAASIIWSASTSHAHRSTTNNQAEYQGLLTGLRGAHRYQWTKLVVVGDSQLILNQLRRYRAPRNVRLLLLYSAARRLADQLGVDPPCSCLQRNGRCAGEHRMDTRSSSQVHHRTTRSHSDIAALLSTDLRPWLATYAARQVT